MEMDSACLVDLARLVLDQHLHSEEDLHDGLMALLLVVAPLVDLRVALLEAAQMLSNGMDMCSTRRTGPSP